MSPADVAQQRTLVQPLATENRAMSVPSMEEDDVLSSAEDESDSSSCSDDYVDDDFDSDDLPSDGDSGMELDPYSSDSDDEDAFVQQPTWDPNPELLWEVWQIDDVRLSENSGEYQVNVLWDWRPTPGARRYRTWEPMDRMAETHAQEVRLAIRFKASGMQHFREFCKTDDEFGKALIAAGDDYACIFRALDIAARAIGRPNLIPDAVVQRYIADNAKRGVDLTRGCTWKQFSGLLPKLVAAHCDLIINQLKKNHIQGGHRGYRVLLELKLENGLYLVGAYNKNFFGHCVVLRVADNGETRSIIDTDAMGNDHEGPVENHTWIYYYPFVRPFRVFGPRP